MNCEKMRDQFSSLLEGGLQPVAEATVREHLDSCRNCQQEWEQFNRTIHWIHTVEDEEVPEGLLGEIRKKREERKGKETQGRAWFLRSAKIPIQAAAMVVIVFLALYLTKMAPFEMYQKSPVEKPDMLQSDREKKELLPPPLFERKDYASDTQPSVIDEKVSAQDSMVQKMQEEVTTPESVRQKEMAKAEGPLLEKRRRESERVGPAMTPLAKKTVRERTLKISDRERAITQVQELAKRFGGDVSRENGDTLLVSLPASSLPEFEKELTQVSPPPEVSQTTVEKDDATVTASLKSKEPEEKGKEPLPPVNLRGDMILLRIYLSRE